MRKIILAVALGSLVSLTPSVQASWLFRLMPGRVAAQPASSLVMVDGALIGVRTSVSHDSERPYYRILPISVAPVAATLPGRTTGVRVEFVRPAQETNDWRPPQIVSIEVLKKGRSQFTTIARPGLMSLGMMRVESTIIFFGHGPAVAAGDDITVTLTLKSARGTVRVNVPAPAVASTESTPYYAIRAPVTRYDR